MIHATSHFNSTGRRGSRPFLSPEVSIEPNDGSGSSLGGRSTRSGRRDSLSPDSATEDGKVNSSTLYLRPCFSTNFNISRRFCGLCLWPLCFNQ